MATGLQKTGRIITSAALLLAVVIGAFSLSGVVFMKMMGIGMLIALLIDATIVRALLVPATMKLLGRWNWWAPAPLARWWERHGFREEGDRPEPATEEKPVPGRSLTGRLPGRGVGRAGMPGRSPRLRPDVTTAAPTRASVGLRSDRGPILGSVMLSIALIAIDATILATAVPAIVRDLGGFTQFPWLFSAYLLTQAISTPIYGKLADTFGRKPLMLVRHRDVRARVGPVRRVVEHGRADRVPGAPGARRRARSSRPA